MRPSSSSRRRPHGGGAGLTRGGGSSGHLNQMDGSVTSPPSSSSPTPSPSPYPSRTSSGPHHNPFPPPPQLHPSTPHAIPSHPSYASPYLSPPSLPPPSSSPPSVYRHPSLHSPTTPSPSSADPSHPHSFHHPTTPSLSSPHRSVPVPTRPFATPPTLSPSPHQRDLSPSRPPPRTSTGKQYQPSPSPLPSSSLPSPASSPFAPRRDLPAPSSPPSSDSSHPDDDPEGAKSQPSVPPTPPEVEALKRTIEHLHRVHLSSMLREQTLEKQLREVELRVRVMEREKAEGAPLGLEAGAGAKSPSGGSPSGVGVERGGDVRGAALTSLPCPYPLPPALTAHLSSLLLHLSPSRASEQRRISVLSWLKALIRKSLGAQCYPVNSYALKTYLAHELMTVSAFFSRAHEPSWLQRVVNALCQEAYATGSGGTGGEGSGGADVSVPTASALHLIQSVTVFFATSKQHAVVRCCIGGIDVSIYGNNVTALGSLALFEHVDHLIGRDHLFKRSIVLFKSWALTKGIYGGNEEDVLLSGLCIRTLTLFIFNRFHAVIHTTLDALLCLLAYFEDFDWDVSALAIYGPVLLSSIDNNQLEAMTEGPHAWPADLSPLVPTSLIHTYQVETRKEAGRVTPPTANYPAGSAFDLPRVNSSMFLDIPEGGVGRSNSDTNLAGKASVSRSSSSSSLSSLPSQSQMIPIAPLKEKGGDRFTPLQQMRPSVFPSSLRSKSYGSLTSLDFTPDHSPQPIPASYHSPHYLNPAPGSFTSTSASSSTSSLSSSSSLSSAAFPPTISSHILPSPSRPPSALGESDAEDEEDGDASSDAFSSDADEPSSPLPVPPPHPLSLYQGAQSDPPIPAYPTCSLNILDAIERGKNLGINVVYRFQYRVRTVLSEGYKRMLAALQGEGGEDGEEDAVLRQLFEAATLSEYKERLYREQKARLAAPSPSSVDEATPTSTPRTFSGGKAVVSTLNPHSSEFVPASAIPSTPVRPSPPTLTIASPTSPQPPSTPPVLSPSEEATAVPPFLSPTSFDPLDGNLPKILTNLTHARQFELPSITERDLLSLLSIILQERGTVPVGRLGSLLHDRTNNHSLPAVLKEQYGGLKRLLERYPEMFVVGKDHPYNPHVRLKGGAGGGAAAMGDGAADGAGGAIAGAPVKRKVQRRRTRVRRVNHRSSSNLASQSTSPLTAAPGPRPPLTPALALDCEMIGTGSGGLHSILARVSLVNSHLEPVYDSYVQPSEAVTDYRTHVSGVTAEHLLNAPPFAVVQREVAALIKGRVLVGHGLGGDMQVLCLGHPRYLLRDTAHCKLICPVRPLGLKRLMMEKFGVEVQEGEHDSVEDAKCAMRLYLAVQQEWEHSLTTQGARVNEPQTTVYHIMP